MLLRKSTLTTSRLYYMCVMSLNIVCDSYMIMIILLHVPLKGYYDAMNPDESTSLPLRLRDKRDVVFGNLPDIYKFHET